MLTPMSIDDVHTPAGVGADLLTYVFTYLLTHTHTPAGVGAQAITANEIEKPIIDGTPAYL